jgi:hypothetical protein
VIQDAEHLHAVARNGVFLPNYANLAEPESLDQCFDDHLMGHRAMGCGCGGRRHHGQFLSGNLAGGGKQNARFRHFKAPFGDWVKLKLKGRWHP